MPNLKTRIVAATLIAPGNACQRCRCGSYLTPRQAQRDGLCRTCADAPAVVAIRKPVRQGRYDR